MNGSGRDSALQNNTGFSGPVIEGTDETGYASRALSVNDSGIAVGLFYLYDEERRISPSHATVFDEGEVSAIVQPVRVGM